MDWLSIAPYWVPGVIALVAVVVVAAAARSRAARRSARRDRYSASTDEWAYLDSSHVGEPHSERQRQRFAAFRARVASGEKRHARR
jgi:hypothetical protein